MCGIAGFYLRSGHSSIKSIEQMCDSLKLRGPDDKGFFLKDNVALAHRRLSVIDVDTGQQPMFSEDKNVVIVFNGEIYNFLAVKNELLLKGRNFTTTSDTEVIIHAYQEYGLSEMLNRLEGMFAFAIWDQLTKKLFLARDRFGEKPLYYLNNEQGFFFGSELKALKPFVKLAEIDREALNLFLTLTYIPAPFTIYQGINKLMPGEVIEIDSKSDSKKWKYYTLPEQIRSTKPYTDYKVAQEELRERVFTSVKQRMIADVPIGSFLSGGVDSSIISAVMALQSDKPINTFSIGFKEKSYDESARADLVAKHIGSNHTLHVIDHNDLLDVVDQVVDYFDEPFADSSALPSFWVAKIAREKVTVVLTGDCADELFGGYEKYLAPYYVERYKKLPAFVKRIAEYLVSVIPHTSLTNHLLRKSKKIIRNSNLDAFDLHYNMMALGFQDHDRISLINESWYRNTKILIRNKYEELPELSNIDKGFFTDINIVLEGDMLTKVDRMCMINSLEARVPYLDSSIVESSFRMPVSFKIQGSDKKKILKNAFADLLPREVFNFKKKGFDAPLVFWFRKELKKNLLETLSKKEIERQGIFKNELIQKLLEEHMSGKENHASKLWCLFVFQKWYKKNFS